MSPITHLLASWVIAAAAIDNPRDRRLVTVAGVLPDADGLGVLVDAFNKMTGHPASHLYQNAHHFLLHGLFGAIVTTALLTAFARRRWRVAGFAFLVFHLHLLCDLVGSRGPTAKDLWPILYLEPFAKHPAWVWTGQWRLDGWQNLVITCLLVSAILWIAITRGYSIVGIFSQRADVVFVGVLRKWNSALARHWPQLKLFVMRPPWRTVVPCISFISLFFLAYAMWQPGLDVRDGDHDRRRNGIWLGHGWLAADAWFVDHSKTNELQHFRNVNHMRELATLLRAHHITDIFPHLCPTDPAGNLPAIDDEQVERFVSTFSGFRVLPWVGGPNGPCARYGDPAWRAAFTRNISRLLTAHPRLAGVQLNIEPLPSGDEQFLILLQELRAALPADKLLSVAAYPPPTRWQPSPDVHWDEAYFRAVARHCDLVAVMMYDTGIRFPKVYQHIVAGWTREILGWSEGKPVLLGVPTYDDHGVGYHWPEVENIRNALLGIHSGLDESAHFRSYQGVALYCEWETSPGEWDYLRKHFLAP